MQGLLAGLQFSHERGVVHRDIKPANVMLTSDGQAKIADFGIARIESSSMTQAGALLGTPAYMSPEQLMGQVVDARTDIYSSGVLLYQLLTGERPFDGGMSSIMHKALNTEPPPPSQLSVTAPPSFDEVVRRAMAKRPENRFSSARAFAEAIRTAMIKPDERAEENTEATLIVAPPEVARDLEPIPEPSATMPAAALAQHSSRPLIAGGAAVVLLVMIGGAWWFLQSSPAPAPAPLDGTPLSPTAQVTDSRPSPPLPTGAGNVAEVHPTSPATLRAPNPSSVAETPGRAGQPTEPERPRPPISGAQPSNTQLAIANLEALRRQIAQWVSSRSCAILGGDLADDGALAIHGYAGNRSIEELRQGVTSFVPPGQIEWRVDGVDPVFCPALNLLHPITPGFGTTGEPRLGLQMVDGKSRLRDGEHIGVRLVMPDFPSRLRVDYFAHDGSVEHLYPQRADPGHGITTDPPRTFRAGEQVNLENAAWLIGPPYGTDMIFAVASSDPLFQRPRPSNEESAEDYLRSLQTEIDNLRLRGAHLAGAAITLEALP
jgi:eukaryotic-like serine/threonine-protein kinase